MTRRSDRCNYQFSNHPFIAYNLGLKRICFLNIDQNESRLTDSRKEGEKKSKTYVLKMDDLESFVGFVSF